MAASEEADIHQEESAAKAAVEADDVAQVSELFKTVREIGRFSLLG
jgi:hypothetical protein